MDFGLALHNLKLGKRVTRALWLSTGLNLWVALQVPDAHSKMGEPYLYASNMSEKLVPWQPAQNDVLASDWQVVD